MAVSNFGALGVSRFHDADLDATASTLVGAAVILYAAEFDNQANAEDSYVKIWDAAAVTVGTTAPDYVFCVPAGEILAVAFSVGHSFANGLIVAGLTTGGTAGSTSPVSDFKGSFVTD